MMESQTISTNHSETKYDNSFNSDDFSDPNKRFSHDNRKQPNKNYRAHNTINGNIPSNFNPLKNKTGKDSKEFFKNEINILNTQARDEDPNVIKKMNMQKRF